MRKSRPALFFIIAAVVVGQGLFIAAGAAFGGTPQGVGADRFEGRYVAGAGDLADLKLIDDSFAFFHPNPDVPNLTMVYAPEWDSFTEGAQWPAWWIQNSYGFSYAATPLLPEPWISALQRSWDHFWNNQGDGKRMGLWDWRHGHYLATLVAPDGCLGDCAAPGCLENPAAFPGSIAYRQGDGNPRIHDWFYEATAAGVVMEAEILLRRHDLKALARYLPKMDRACNCIEKTRDVKNGLFLVGPACDLLAPAYGGVKRPDGTFGKGYLAGVSITYLAALDRMVELYTLAGDREKLADYRQRQLVTRRSLAQLLTPEGYFVKSLEPDGVKHGVLGQARFGYLDGVANADAAALRVVDDATAASIYRQIAGFPAIRPFDFLLTNAPGLDDTYFNYGGTQFQATGGNSILKFGCWVNGGVWGTVEGRAILMYYRAGRFDDVRRSAQRALKWAYDFRMEDHLTQRGENTDNLWYDKPPYNRGSIAVTIDNFAIPAATIRGLFDYDYRADRLILRPRLPGSIAEYEQKEPVFFGEKTLYLSCRNGGPKVKSVTVNGQGVDVPSPDAAVLTYDKLPKIARVQIVTEGAAEPAHAAAPRAAPGATAQATSAAEAKLPEALKTRAAVLAAMDRLLAHEPDAPEERAFVRETLAAIEAWRQRTAIEPRQGFFRPMTPEKRTLILACYENAAKKMYDGFAQRMDRYAWGKDARQLRIARLFHEAQSP
jgi:hypothetical protein